MGRKGCDALGAAGDYQVRSLQAGRPRMRKNLFGVWQRLKDGWAGGKGDQQQPRGGVIRPPPQNRAIKGGATRKEG